jgi:DNA repair exonuclease SbcCD ATPase subunit
MLLYPTELQLTNIGPYTGHHTIDLIDDVYAIVAKHVDNPERSNWIGKSTLLWCIPYALFGEHPAKNDNEWITNGETYAEAKLTLSDGSIIRRTKPRDKTAQLSFKDANGVELLQGAAQDAIEKLIGLSKDEFMTVCFYAQKELSRLVSSNSSDRVAIVEAWIAQELEPIQRLHARAVDDFAKCLQAVEQKKAEMDAVRTNVEQVYQRHSWTEGVDAIGSLDTMLRHIGADVALTRGRLDDANQKRLAAETWNAKVEIAQEFDLIVEKGNSLRKEFDSIPNGATEEAIRLGAVRDKLFAESVEAESALKQARAGGKTFNGECPVNCLDCPSADWVKQNPLSQLLVSRRDEIARTLAKELEDKRNRVNELQRQASRRAVLEGKLEELREQAGALVDTANEVAESNEAPDIDALDTIVRQCAAEVRRLEDEQRVMQAEKVFLEKMSKQMQSWLADDAALRKKRVMLGEAVQLLGKAGLQQQLGEIALVHVEAGANAMLASAGIQLTVQVLWAVHHQGLAKHCDKCGTAYVTSARVKQCSRCGAARGPNVTAKLVIDLSNRSGAAEDLAGIAVGLAASVWLRGKRAASWGSVCIDEPFGALDQHNKKALSVHVATLLKQSFSSAFIVAHDREILDALPQRINIVGTDQGSKIEAP